MPLTQITQYMNDEKKKLKDSKNAMTKKEKLEVGGDGGEIAGPLVRIWCSV